MLLRKWISSNFLQTELPTNYSLKNYIYNHLTEQTNDWCLIKLFVLDSNTWNNLTTFTNPSRIILKQSLTGLNSQFSFF